MDRPIADPLLLVGEVSEVRGSKVKVRIYSEANESHIFYHGSLVRGVSVGGYVKIPCGFDDVIGAIEGDYQQESRVRPGDDREAPGSYLERYVDVSVFGVMSLGRFDRGVTVLPLVRSKAYVLAPDEIDAISSPDGDEGKGGFRIGALAGHGGVPVTVPADKLFASHIGVFGNTGSGKSNTLCRLYTDFLALRENPGGTRNRFVVIDFNGEYVGRQVLTPDKTTYELSTRKGGGDRIPVPSDFYFDVDTWAMLSQATDRTHRPLLRRLVSVASAISQASDKPAYVAGMLKRLFRGYFGKPLKFIEQKDDIAHLLAMIVKGKTKEHVERSVYDALDPIGIHSGGSATKLHIKETSEYLNSADEADGFFRCVHGLEKDFGAFLVDSTRLLEFAAWFVFVERYRDGYIVREHVTPWLNRYTSQLREASKLYEVIPWYSDEEWPPVAVVSLLDVNQEQKKVVPLVVAKTLYQGQKLRGRDDERSSTHLIVDEAHNILSYSSQRESEDWRDYRLETFEEIVKEGRKFGMYLTVCSQRPADISPTIISQMHNYFIHRLVNDEDLRAIGKAVAFIDAANMSMVPVLPQGCCIASGTAFSYPVRVQVDMLERERQPMSFDRNLLAALLDQG